MYYVWRSSERFRILNWANDKEYYNANIFSDCMPINELWKPYPMVFETSKKEISDFPCSTSSFPAISSRALRHLRGLIEPHVEILPLNIVNTEDVYFGLNVLKIYDVDYARSVLSGSMVRKSVDSLHFSNVVIHVFPDDVLPESPIFRIKITKHFRIYVSDEFRSVVETNGLTGFEFTEEMRYRTGPTLGEFIDWNGRAYRTDSHGVPYKYDSVSTNNECRGN